MKTDLLNYLKVHLALYMTPRTAWHIVNNQRAPHQLKPEQQQRIRDLTPQQLEHTLSWESQHAHHHILTLQDPRYPPLLKEISDPPIVLFVIGDANKLTQPQIAIVGSRRPTPSASHNSRQLANALSQAGLAITSGLARGIDGQAHLGALDANGVSIAVLGCGVDRLYPQQHHTIYKRIQNQGALVSELPLGSPPLAHHFPRRNRIISGLSLGTLVIEAAIKSGSLITAYQALEQNRAVLAVPGPIANPLSDGCHQLIRDGATLVRSARDVLDELNLMPVQIESELSHSPMTSLDQSTQKLLEYVTFEIQTVQELIDKTGISAEMIAAELLKLELHGYIKAIPGGYSRVK